MYGIEGVEGKLDGSLCGGILGQLAGFVVVEENQWERQEREGLYHFPLAGHGGSGTLEQIGDKAQEATVPNCQKSTCG